MPLEVRTPLFGKMVLSDRTLTSMLDVIDKTFKYGEEWGMPFCKTDAVIDPGETCEGDDCSVDIQPCPPGTEKVGDFHTHTTTEDHRGYAHPSIIDSAGDLIQGSKLACIWGRYDNEVNCRSLSREPTTAEKEEVDRQFRATEGQLRQIALGMPLSPEDLKRVRALNTLLDKYFAEVLRTDRAGLSEAMAKPRSLEDCLTFYSHKELAERAKRASISTEGGKKELCKKLLEAGVL